MSEEESTPSPVSKPDGTPQTGDYSSKPLPRPRQPSATLLETTVTPPPIAMDITLATTENNGQDGRELDSNPNHNPPTDVIPTMVSQTVI